MSDASTRACTFVLLGGTGDLAHKKILPAFGTLRQRGDIDDRCALVGVTRDTTLDDEKYRALVCEVLAAQQLDSREIRDWVNRRVFYQPLMGNNDDPADDAKEFGALAEKLTAVDRARGGPPNRVFYMALPPVAFRPTIEGMGAAGLNKPPREGKGNGRGGDGPKPWTRIVIEKPFGRDLATSEALNALVHRWFDESQVYRIDHYLGKETVQNLLVFRFANSVFESIWNRDHVESVQITVAEQIGIEERAAYYEQAGVVRDIIQNHALQLLTLVAMEVPAMMSADSIRQEKVKVLTQVQPVLPQDVALGQYARGAIDGAEVCGYREEDKVSDSSRTPTYASVQLSIDSWRWQGVPFYIRAGKRMAKRVTEIEVKFRRPPVWLFRPMGSPDVHRNTLRMTIQPREGFALYFHVKAPGKPLKLERLPLDFYYSERYKSLPEAYQTLLLDVMDGDQTLFVRADEVEAAWRLVAPMLDPDLPVSEYDAGTWGPESADALLARSGHWWGDR
jgi:glucose-6-phosphate 1-dehydrogenase